MAFFMISIAIFNEKCCICYIVCYLTIQPYSKLVTHLSFQCFHIVVVNKVTVAKDLTCMFTSDMREHTKHPYRICKILVGRHNSSIPLMCRCLVMFVLFHNILSFMTELKKNIKCYHIHMWEVIQVKRVTNFCTDHGFLHYPNQKASKPEASTRRTSQYFYKC